MPSIVAVTVRGSAFQNDPTAVPPRVIKAPDAIVGTLGFRTRIAGRAPR